MAKIHAKQGIRKFLFARLPFVANAIGDESFANEEIKNGVKDSEGYGRNNTRPAIARRVQEHQRGFGNTRWRSWIARDAGSSRLALTRWRLLRFQKGLQKGV